MICIYCNNETKYKSGWDYCEECCIFYVTNSHANMVVKDGYKTTSLFDDPYFQFKLPPQEPLATINFGGKVLITFNYMPNITPQNIKEKLKFYLLFT